MDTAQQSSFAHRDWTQFMVSTTNVVRAVADALAVLTAFAVSYSGYVWLVTHDVLPRPVPDRLAYIVIAFVIAAIAVAVFAYLGSYRERASVLNLWELQVAVKGHLLTAAFFFAILFIINGGYSRIIVAGGLTVAVLFTLVERRLIAAVLRSLQVSGRIGRRVVIAGCGEAGQLLMKKIVQAPHVGRTVVGFVDDTMSVGRFIECRITQADQTIFCAPVLGRLEDLPNIVDVHVVDELLVTAHASDTHDLAAILDLADMCGVRVALMPQLGDLRVDQLQVEDLSAIPLLRPYTPSARPLYLILKRLSDIAGALLLFVLTSPLWVLAALAIRLTSQGPVFFSQQRIGLNGQPFRMLKFRTMRIDTSPYAVSPAHDHDPRITGVGRILRTAGLDELPQIVNVLRGDMSLVGPRPEMPFIVKEYTPLQRQRLAVKPGITGLWQLSAERHDAIHVNLEYDFHYIRHQSLLLDGLILLETLIFTLEVAGKRIGRWIRGVFSRRDTTAHGQETPVSNMGASVDHPEPRERRWVPRPTLMTPRERTRSLGREHQRQVPQNTPLGAASHLTVEETD